MKRLRLPVFLTAALLSGAAPSAMGAVLMAGKYTWFDETPGQRPLWGAGTLLRGDTTRIQFDIPLKSLSIRDEDIAGSPASEPAWGTLRVYRIQSDILSADTDPRQTSTVGVNWQHQLFPQDRISLTAETGENRNLNLFSQDTVESRAAFSWTREWNVRWRPSLTGSMFIGDETPRSESYRPQLGRRYVGMSVGGQMNIGRDHTPYVSYQLRRSYYDQEAGTEDLSLLPPRTDDRSLLTAGWRWQATRQLSLKAEASFGLNPDGFDLYNQERTRVFFGTRFDFR